MLNTAPAVAMMVTTNPDRTRRFYGDVLGLRLVLDAPEEAAIMYEAGQGTRLALYLRDRPSGSDATAVSFFVDDVRSAVRELKQRGVTFEEYDMPGIKTVDGIATVGQEQAAWFKDPDGNILAIVRMSE